MTAGADLVGSGFPRDLAESAPLTLPVSIVIRANLTTADIAETLAVATGRAPAPLRNRRLRGCLVAHRGCGMIFLDEDDAALVRFALAHELAHFAGHYLTRRELAIARLGPGIVDVLDGVRAPMAQERLAGILTGCPLGAFTDVMERDDGVPLTAAAEIMEYEADEAAFLALAPIGIVIARTIERGNGVGRQAVTMTLIEAFGLSASDADRHAPRIVNAIGRSWPSLVEQLRKAASEMERERHM
ncbi:hypothetical protein NX02_19700 [Sphingomonas sanxanigenens DSM 19645 = NX02]|uniref:IrrE N-terminal-like domain-containing protein n=2 Tax=Sphingomonas sanxanigenens TaxID=397260 RepID=W0ACI4_9SPHN|nr:hypothetical protein NX02_19700 [Sphingomonas sanxanigenens DSM 19645 = NX02]